MLRDGGSESRRALGRGIEPARLVPGGIGEAAKGRSRKSEDGQTTARGNHNDDGLDCFAVEHGDGGYAASCLREAAKG